MTDDPKDGHIADRTGDGVSRAFARRANIRDLFGRLKSLASPTGPEPFSVETIVRDPYAGSRGRRWSLDQLGDPRQFTHPISIDGWSTGVLRVFLERMLFIRAVEEHLALLADRGVIRGPLHLAIGQEAVATGVSHHLTAHDRVFGGHRSNAHFLALGGDTVGLFAESLGRGDGPSRGQGGPMHLSAPECGFLGASPIVGSTVPIAAGAALAALKDGSDAISVAYFGDGAVEQGVVHETLNLAATMRLPMLFVCENNLYAGHLDIAFRQPTDSTARIADAHGIPAAVVDGNNVIDVADAARTLIARARRSEGPGYLEAVTYRWRSHVGAGDTYEVRLRRPAKELAAWKRRDPIRRLEDAMVARGDISPDELATLIEEIQDRVATIADRIVEAPEIDPSTSEVTVHNADDH